LITEKDKKKPYSKDSNALGYVLLNIFALLVIANGLRQLADAGDRLLKLLKSSPPR